MAGKRRHVSVLLWHGVIDSLLEEEKRKELLPSLGDSLAFSAQHLDRHCSVDVLCFKP